ncbi:hypothetical protein [Streptomyces sp. NPDC050560]|uniref:hypothetical protein n=1 Tax=Streptomyces sp. NPDC050560 TaxID=3365630 RepID=UPI00378BFD71
MSPRTAARARNERAVRRSPGRARTACGRVCRAAAGAVSALALTGAALLATGGQAAADPAAMGQCTTSSGAVLAVDFSHWGGPVLRSCGTTPTTGYELLNQGGWHTTGTGHDGPAFICRIGYSGYQGGREYPTAADEDCVLTPPASAYWSYWHADPGDDDWEYSQLGAMLYKPRPGSVDLWSFGGTDIQGSEGRPRITPDQLRARNTRPQGGGNPASTAKAPPLPPGVDTGPAPEHRQHRPAPAKSTPPRHTHSATPHATHHSADAAPSTTPSHSPPTTPTAGAHASTGPRVVDAAPTARAHHDPGSLVPAATGAGLVLFIGGAAFHLARRRRRTG